MKKTCSRLFLLICMCATAGAFAQSAAPSSIVAVSSIKSSATLTENDAEKKVQSLPEFQQYAKERSRRAGGQAQLFVEENVETVGSRKYWSVTAVAKRGDKLEQWATFFVRLDGMEILVVDHVIGERMSLQDWRARLAKK